MTDTDKVLTYRKEGDIGIISLNRPEKRNALNRALSQALMEALDAADQDPEVTVIVLRGEGKSFCAGHDVERNDPEREKDRHHAIRTHHRLSRGLRLAAAIWDLHTPIIASVQGHALGEGCVMTMLCDLTIAAEDALFGEPEIRFAGPATAMMMPWVIGLKRARELIYMGDMIGAAEARDIGMVNRVVPADQLEEATLKYARRLALIGPEALFCARTSINRILEAQGIRMAFNSSVDLIAPTYATESRVHRDFQAKVAELGLAGAFKWRRDQFKE